MIGIHRQNMNTACRRSRAPLRFGLFCLDAAAGFLNTGARIIMTLTPGRDWGLRMVAVSGTGPPPSGFWAVDCSPGNGTTAPIPPPETAAEKTAMPRAPLEGETILLVEDEPIVREINHQLLAAIGYRVLDAEDGQSALALAKEHRQRIALVLLDIHLPDIPGKRLLPLLKELLPAAKLMICSGGSTDGLLEKGAHGFLQKPLSLEKLSAALADISGGK